MCWSAFFLLMICVYDIYRSHYSRGHIQEVIMIEGDCNS